MRPLLLALAAAVVLGISGAASAGDFADLNILGFSPDGGYFAFEEFGELDGSGGHYSTIYVIDTNTDSWVQGTPIRVRPEDVDIDLATVRADAARRVKPLLTKYAIAPRGRKVVSNRATELSANPYEVKFLVDLYANWGDHSWTLTLNPIAFPDPVGCENLGPVKGFSLVLANFTGESQVLHTDTTVPGSRGCSQDYAISDVVTYLPDAGSAGTIVALLYVITQGFEGPDRRFLAVTAHFKNH